MTTTRRMLLSAVTLPLLGGLARPATAASDPVLLTESQRRWVVSNPVVRFGMANRARPFYFLEAGRPKGIVADMLARIGETTGLDFRFADLPGPTEALRALAEGDISLIPYLRIDEAREKVYAFTRPIVKLTMGIFTGIDSPYVDGFADLSGRTVGVPPGMSETFGRQGPGSVFLEYVTIEGLVRALRDRKVEAIVATVPAVQQELRRQRVSDSVMLQTTLSTKVPFGMACAPPAAALVEILDRALERILVQERRDMAERYATGRESQSGSGLGLAQAGMIGATVLAAAGCYAVAVRRYGRPAARRRDD